MQKVPVLIAGAGVTGLSASLFLAQQGVRSLVVERREGTSLLPRARGVNGRTMELMRELGLADEIRAAGERLAPAVGLYRARTLVDMLRREGRGSWLTQTARARGFRGQESKASPTGPCRCTQDLFEPILLRAAHERGVDARFSTELTSFAQDAAGVTAALRDCKTGAERSVGADYLIGADGARSVVRATLGIARSGSPAYGHMVNVLFRAELASLVRGREFSLCLVENAAMRGLIASIDNAHTWAIHIPYDPERGERPEDFTVSRCETLVRDAVGIADLKVEIVGVSPWQSAVRLAERYRQGRVFLAGDAAHSMPPWGGLGANTAIQDAHNLAWKLALVLSGAARDELLDTYEIERLPIGRAAGEISGSLNGEHGLLAVPQRLGMLGVLWAMRRVFPYSTMGYGYTSSAVVLERGARPGPGTVSLRGQPGTRVPHVWITRGTQCMSTLDLVGRRFVLLAGPDGSPWCDAGSTEAQRLGVRLDCESISEIRPLGIRRDGALLVRPDGMVGWRSKRSGPPQLLAKAFRQILALST